MLKVRKFSLTMRVTRRVRECEQKEKYLKCKKVPILNGIKVPILNGMFFMCCYNVKFVLVCYIVSIVMNKCNNTAFRNVVVLLLSRIWQEQSFRGFLNSPSRFRGFLNSPYRVIVRTRVSLQLCTRTIMFCKPFLQFKQLVAVTIVLISFSIKCAMVGCRVWTRISGTIFSK